MLALPDGAKLRRTWPQRFLLLVNLAVIIACFGAAAALAYVDNKVGQLQRVSLGQVLSSASAQAGSGGPENILLVGVDSEEGLDPNDPRMQGRDEGLRSDTIMLLRVDPAAAKAAILSFPRDLWVPLGGSGQRSKINAALPIGGPDLLIRTITANFGIPINHYVQVDFAQFQKLVDVVGGVPISFDKPVRDEWTGLQIDEPGCVTLDGSRALDYVRSRYFEYFDDGRWHLDGNADLSRIDRQQDFVKKALKRAVAKGLRNPITMNKLLNVALDSVTVDDQFQASDIAALANRFRSFNPDSLDTYPLPVYNDWAGDAAIVRLIDAQARPVLDVFRGHSGDASAPSAVDVTVLNGTGRTDEGRLTANGLARAGFVIDDIGDAASSGSPHSQVRYAPGNEGAAVLVARYLEGGVDFVADAGAGDGVVVVTGRDLLGVRSDPLPAGSVPVPAASSSTSTTSSTSPAVDSSSVSTGASPPASVTTTTRTGVVPSEGRDDLCH